MPYTLWSVLGPGDAGGMGSHPTLCDTPAHSNDQVPLLWQAGPGQPLDSLWPVVLMLLLDHCNTDVKYHHFQVLTVMGY